MISVFLINKQQARGKQHSKKAQNEVTKARAKVITITYIIKIMIINYDSYYNHYYSFWSIAKEYIGY